MQHKKCIFTNLKIIIMSIKLNRLAKDVKRNETGTMCIDATTNKSEKACNDQIALDSKIESLGVREKSATETIKEDVQSLFDSKVNELYYSCLLNSVSVEERTLLNSVSQCGKYFITESYKGENAIKTETFATKKSEVTFYFIEMPKLSASSCATLLNNCKDYLKAYNFNKENANEIKAKELQAKITALQTVISITTDETVLAVLNAKLQELQK